MRSAVADRTQGVNRTVALTPSCDLRLLLCGKRDKGTQARPRPIIREALAWPIAGAE